MDRYHNLIEMLALNYSAHAYFDDLPDYVRDMVASRGENLHSCAELQGYAEKLLQGDC